MRWSGRARERVLPLRRRSSTLPSRCAGASLLLECGVPPSAFRAAVCSPLRLPAWRSLVGLGNGNASSERLPRTLERDAAGDELAG
jgi:hypothetical protein